MEGRCAVHHFDEDEKVGDFSFKCHQDRTGTKSNVYPVNVIKFHESFNSFVTGGDNGVISVWDKDTRCLLGRFKQIETKREENTLDENNNVLAKESMPITSIDFSRNGDIMPI